MNLFRHTVRTLCSFSRGERLGLSVLFALSAGIILVPVLTPTPPAPDYAELRDYMRRIDSLHALSAAMDSAVERTDYSRFSASQGTFSPPERAELFPFDPNTADSLTFQRLGFSSRQAAVIIRYRNSGAKFRTPDDFAKVYVVDENMFTRLSPYISILPDNETTPVPAANMETGNVPATTMVEINVADTTALKTVRGIGSYFAGAIVELRTRLGGFTQIEQLLEIRGMDEERLQPLRNQLTIDTDLVRKINLQTADEQTLRSHPYIGAYTARGILLYRRSNPHCTLDDLVVNNILQKAQAEKLVGYVE